MATRISLVQSELSIGSQVVLKATVRSKRFTYGLAVFVAMIFFFPFRNESWSVYLGACAGYTSLVFGLRRIERRKPSSQPRPELPAAKLALNHSKFLVAVVAWVWLLKEAKPRLPYLLRTEDTSHPYFGLIFIGVLGLMMLELYEQRWLRGTAAGKAAIETVLARE